MSVFLRYLMSLLVHMTWMRMGKSGPVPPVNLPRKGPVNLPVIGPWQVMIGMWLMNKMWEKYGRDLKTHLTDPDYPATKGVNSMLHNARNAARNVVTKTRAAQNSANAGSSNLAGKASAAGIPATVFVSGSGNTASTAAAGTSPSHDTQPLTPSTPAAPAAHGSLLSRLRGGASS